MEEDRISQLPDPILQQILSLIDINQAVETSILSTRWKNLWRSLSDLHFNQTHFTALVNAEASNPFPPFVSNFLSHRDDAAPIRNFHLSFDTSWPVHEDQEFVEECVRYAINHAVQSLRLHCNNPRTYEPLTLTAALFASETLRELELSQFSCGIYVPGQFCLPHLETLYLDSYMLIHGGELYTISEETFSGFPELEKLTLRWCMLPRLVVKAPKLRFLEIKQGSMMDEFSAPFVTSFRYEGSFPFQDRAKVNLPMLEEVYLDIDTRLKELGTHVKCVRMLQQLGNAKIVALTLDTLKVLEKDLVEQSPYPFPYLKCLKLIKGCGETSTLLQSVLNYLTVGSSSSMVEFPDGVDVVEENLNDQDDSDDQLQLQLQLLFGT